MAESLSDDAATVVGQRRDRPGVVVDGGDGELLAGDELCRLVRGEGHHAVSDGVAAPARRDEVLTVELPEFVVAGPGEAVEVADVLPA